MAKQNKKKSKVKGLIFITLGVLVAGGVIAKRAGWIGQEPLLKVKIESPSMRTLTEVISASGKIQPEVEVKIAPEVSGEIVELPVKEGDYVEKGQLLAKIKPDTYISIKERAEAAVNASKQQLFQAEAQLIQAKQTFDRQKQLYDQKVISSSDFEVAQSTYNQNLAMKRAAEFNVKSSQASMKETVENYQKTTIYAPSSGTISKLNVELGERVVGTAQMAGTEILRIADLSRMEVLAKVNENDIVRVKLGDTTMIEVDAYLDKKFKGVVTEISNSASSTTSVDQVTNFDVVIYILPESYASIRDPQKPSPFRPGMSANVDIQTQTVRALSIPIQAITMRAKVADADTKEQIVWVYDRASSTVKRVVTSSGIQDKLHIQVISGVDSTMSVVVSPFSAISKALTDSMKVDIEK